MQKKSDLYVLTKAKDLSKYIFTITEKSPKKFKFSLVVRLQNLMLDVLEGIYLANSEKDIYAQQKMLKKMQFLLKMAKSAGFAKTVDISTLVKKHQRFAQFVLTLRHILKFYQKIINIKKGLCVFAKSFLCFIFITVLLITTKTPATKHLVAGVS